MRALAVLLAIWQLCHVVHSFSCTSLHLVALDVCLLLDFFPCCSHPPNPSLLAPCPVARRDLQGAPMMCICRDVEACSSEVNENYRLRMQSCLASGNGMQVPRRPVFVLPASRLCFTRFPCVHGNSKHAPAWQIFNANTRWMRPPSAISLTLPPRTRRRARAAKIRIVPPRLRAWGWTPSSRAPRNMVPSPFTNCEIHPWFASAVKVKLVSTRPIRLTKRR